MYEYGEMIAPSEKDHEELQMTVKDIKENMDIYKKGLEAAQEMPSYLQEFYLDVCRYNESSNLGLLYEDKKNLALGNVIELFRPFPKDKMEEVKEGVMVDLISELLPSLAKGIKDYQIVYGEVYDGDREITPYIKSIFKAEMEDLGYIISFFPIIDPIFSADTGRLLYIKTDEVT